MICYRCKNQMHQYNKVGGGYSAKDGLIYVTWELKYCSSCDVYVRESYEAEVLSGYQVSKLIEEYGENNRG